MSRSSLAFGLSLILLFVSERLLGGEGASSSVVWVMRALGLAAMLSAIVFRLRLIKESEGRALQAHRIALGLTLLGIASLATYLLSTDLVVDALGLQTESARRWSGVLGALWPIGVLLASLPLVLVDLVVSETAGNLHPKRLAVALEVGLVLALATACVFPLNLIAHRFNHRSDQRYLKTTSVGEASLALAHSLTEPLRVVLFFPPANEVEREVLPYFEALAASSEQISVESADQALQPDLAKELRVSSNGTVALIKGDDSERINLGTSLDGARKLLKKLDQEVLDHLQKLATKTRVVYVTGGHGEAHWVGSDLPGQRKISGLKQILESMNYRVKSLNLDTGLGREIPSDAAMVLIPGPRSAFLPEEIGALRAYRDGGGQLLLAIDAQPLDGPLQEAKPDPALAALFGVKVTWAIAHHPRDHIVRDRSPSDESLLATNAYSTHASVATLARYKGQMIYLAPMSVSFEVATADGELVTPTLRTRAGAYSDLNGDHQQEAELEKFQTLDLAVAWEKRDSKARGVVIGSLASLSDAVLRNQANQQFFYDSVRWLMGEEKLSGTVETEEDVRIEHTRDQDKIWFYGTSLLMPAGLVFLGLLRVRRRRRRS